MQGVDNANKHAIQELNNLKRSFEVVSKENRQLKKTVYAFQLWSKVPGGLSNQQPIAASYNVVAHVPLIS